jgi:hypothetical protein
VEVGGERLRRGSTRDVEVEADGMAPTVEIRQPAPLEAFPSPSA